MHYTVQSLIYSCRFYLRNSASKAMSQECSVRDKVLVDTTPDGLVKMKSSILNLIKKHLFPDAKQVNPPTSVILEISTPTRIRYTSPPEELVFEIDAMDLFQHFGLPVPGLCGYYIPSEGKTYLVKDTWCLETLIHETLHSCSRPCLEPELSKYDELFDGLTELYTGYIIFKEFSECYTNCFLPEGQLCEIGYPDYTKLWTTFCNFVSLKNTIQIYFPTEKIWDEEVDAFVERVKHLGFDKFKNPFAAASLASLKRFELICNNTFGDDYFTICKKRMLYSNFSNVIDT